MKAETRAVHEVLKNYLAAGVMPSNDFVANAERLRLTSPAR